MTTTAARTLIIIIIIIIIILNWFQQLEFFSLDSFCAILGFAAPSYIHRSKIPIAAAIGKPPEENAPFPQLPEGRRERCGDFRNAWWSSVICCFFFLGGGLKFAFAMIASWLPKFRNPCFFFIMKIRFCPKNISNKIIFVGNIQGNSAPSLLPSVVRYTNCKHPHLQTAHPS